MPGVCFYGPKWITVIQLRMTLKYMSGICFYGPNLITVTFSSVFCRNGPKNYGNIQFRILNVGCLHGPKLGNIQLRMTLKYMPGVCFYGPKILR